MTGDFNIRDSNWNSLYLFHSIHSNLLVNIVDTFDLSLSYSNNSVPIRYSNSVINLMFFRLNTLEFDNHTILPELQYFYNHTSLGVDIHIIEEFIQDKRHIIIKGSKEDSKFTCELIENIKRINTSQLMDRKSLELAVQEFIRILNLLWQKHSKCIKITKHSKEW